MEHPMSLHADPILPLLTPGERIELALKGADGHLRVTDRRVVVTHDALVRLAVTFAALRRIELDVEAGGKGVLTIVPHHAWDQPQMLSVRRDDLQHAAEIVAFVGERLS
jgi:hypothetical protein